jgi:hypothetical protein
LLTGSFPQEEESSDDKAEEEQEESKDEPEEDEEEEEEEEEEIVDPKETLEEGESSFIHFSKRLVGHQMRACVVQLCQLHIFQNNSDSLHIHTHTHHLFLLIRVHMACPQHYTNGLQSARNQRPVRQQSTTLTSALSVLPKPADPRTSSCQTKTALKNVSCPPVNALETAV